MTTAVSLDKKIQLIRYHSMQIRRLNARLISGDVRNSSTRAARKRHESARAAISKELVDVGLRDLVGLLVEESNLRQRIHGHAYRGDLKNRLDSVLQDIRLRTKGVGKMPFPMAAVMAYSR